MSKCKAGDKVRVIKDINYCDTIKKGDVVEIDRAEYGAYYIKGHIFNDGTEDQYWMWGSEFELFEGDGESDKKYIWYLEVEDVTYFLNNLLGVEKWRSHETEEIKNDKDMCYLLTEDEAKKSPFFDKFTKHDPFEEKWYYIRMKGNDEDYLNLNFNDDIYFMDDEDERGFYKVKFTEEECNEIIGTSSILYKELFE